MPDLIRDLEEKVVSFLVLKVIRPENTEGYQARSTRGT
jgi:hypothetical protein